MAKQPPAFKHTAVTVQSRKGADPLVAVTCYDYTFARLVDEFADIVLVGDSLGMVVQGEHNTLGVTVDDVVYHTRAVSKGLHRAHLVADLPFGSYQGCVRDAVNAATRLLGEGKAEAVKLEGGVAMADTVDRLVSIGVPVMGHIGLTPQSVHQFGGFKVQGRSDEARTMILKDALALQDAGVYSIVLEGIPAPLAKEITAELRVPTIGIGAGPSCDGQVLVITDLLGLNPSFKPKFVKNFASLSSAVSEALSAYRREVKAGTFPDKEHSF
ncbi:3-methyl-2-oxobutanoate hydroxymethyltransferase [bacterium]|nr:3-methyl-2-oxobutanoate hydroxymethyltransferase [bacterium]